MSAQSRVDPFNALLPDMLRRLAGPLGLAEPMACEIRLDVIENDSDYDVRAELPGARKEDVSVMVDGSFVSISAEIRDEGALPAGSRVLLKESTPGRVARGLALAHEIDAGGVVARLEHGVLRLTLPKRESARSRTIAVQ